MSNRMPKSFNSLPRQQSAAGISNRKGLRIQIGTGTGRPAAVVCPRHGKTAVIQCRHRRLCLTTIGIGIDRELFTQRLTANIKTLTKDTPCRAVVLVLRLPGHDHAAVGKRGRRRIGLLVIGRAVDLKLFLHSRAVGTDDNLIRRCARCHDNRIRSAGIKNINQTALDVGHRIAVLNTVARLGRIDRHRIDVTSLNRAGKGNLVRLVRLVLAKSNHRIITVAELDRLRIGYRNIIVTGTQRQRIQAVTKVDGQTILGRIKDQRLIARTTHKLDIACLGTVRIEVLGVHTPCAAAVLITRFPGHHEAAIVQHRHYRILLTVICLRINLELITHRRAAGIIALCRNAVIAAILAIRTPGYNKAVTAETGHRRVKLLA